MAKQSTNYAPRGFSNGGHKFTSADGTASVALTTGGDNDATVKGIGITSTDTVARVLELILYYGGAERVIDSLTIPAGAGTNGTSPAVDGLTAAWLPKDAVEKAILSLQGVVEMRARMQVAVASGKEVNVTTISELF